MAEKILDNTLLIYLLVTIIAFTVPLIISMFFDGIEGLKDWCYDIKYKTYYINTVIPAFMLTTLILIIIFLINNFIII